MAHQSKKSQRVLLTGNNGYLGAVMGPWLRNAGHDVVGLDTNYFADCTLAPDGEEIPTIRKDLREIEASDVEGFDAVIHLAALSNDPIGNLNSRWTNQINFEGTIRAAKLAKAAGARRFIFSSSCIMYGMSTAAVADETSPLAPGTDYARSKVEAEMALRELADDGFSPVYCRNGTVYGLSPRMRFDTVLNNFMGSACATGRIEVFSDGAPWRPVVHIQDVARAFEMMLTAPIEKIHNEAFNIGADKLNYQIRDLAEIAARAVPGCELVQTPRPGADQRTYRAGFDKFSRTFPDFAFRWTAEEGARQLYEAFRSIGLTAAEFVDKRFTRLQWLRHLVDNGLVDNDLFWTVKAARAA